MSPTFLRAHVIVSKIERGGGQQTYGRALPAISVTAHDHLGTEVEFVMIPPYALDVQVGKMLVVDISEGRE